MPDASTPSDPSGDGAPAAEAALAPGAETAPVTPEEAPDDPYADTPDDELLVVGLGASAGGVEALERFFSALPDMPGAAFVVVLHLSPDHESHLAEVLQRATAMPVQQVRRAVRTEANHVYVIPPNRSLSMADGTLELSAYADDGERRAPIDLFFRTLGTEHRRCAAVVLSGTGADGSVGIKRVHEAGGLVLAQEPMDAAYDAMPLNAVETGLVDAVGTAEALARRVAAFVDSTAVVRLPDGAPESDTEALVQLLASLRARTGHDFAHYKRATVMRRIARRMHVHSLASLTEYASLVRSSTDEAAALLQDLLISVTNFFRDPAAWKALAETVVPQLFEGKGPGDTIRVWSAACATGEEAYSLAMLLAEHAATLERPPAFQVFASDIDEDSLARAREGRYSEAIVADVSAERLARFFNPEHGHFCVRKEIRERVLFSSHSLIKDPPFSRLDLIACRNLLIYLQREVQVRVFELFHYALAPGGVLFLGSSEAADVVDDLYRPLDGSQRIFQRRASARAAAMLPRMPLQPARVAPQRAARGPGGRVITPRSTGAVAADLHQRLLEAYAPPSAVVDERHEIVHLSETAGRFLRFSGGVPSTNIVQAVAPELQLELRLALHRAFQQGKSTSGGPIRVNVGGEETHVHLIVRPGVPDGTDEALALVIFTEVEAEPAPAGRTGDPPTDALVAGLEAELDRTRERLQLTVEEHETIVEELRASNEELQSVNEEYRSATEELETSREELQSVNEELVTVNNELTAHVDEVTRVHSDLQHLMSSTEIGTLFVDRDLRVQRYTPRVARLFNVVAGDRGRPLAHVTHRLHDIDLTADAAGVLASLVPAEREVRTHDGETYLVRIRPYRTVDDRIEGVVLTFVDITARVEAETALRESEEQRRLAMEAAAMGTFVWPIGGETVEADARLRAVFGLPPGTDPLPTADFRALIHPDDVPQLAAVRDAAETEGAHTGVDFRVVQPTGEVRHVEVRSRTFGEGDGRRSVGLVLDVTERVRADEALRASEARLRLATESGGVAVGIWDFVTGRVTGDARLAFLYGLDEAEVTSPEGTDSAALFARIHPEDLPAVEAASAREIETGAGGYSVEYRALGADGVWRSLLIHAAVERSPEGEPVRFAGAILDVTERVAAEEALRASEVRFRTLFETIDEGFALCEMITDDAGEPVSYRFLDTNPAFRAMTGLDVIGKTVHEVLPDEAEAWIAHFAPVALGGETVRFEQAANAIGQTFSVYASPAEPTGSGRFTQVFSDVTVQRRAAEALEADARRSGYRVALADALRLLSDPREVQGAAARVLGEYLGAMRVHYAEVEPDDVHAVVADEYVQDAAPATGRHRLDDFGPTLNEAYRAGQGRAVPDVEAEASLAEPERAAYRALGIAALVAVPLVKNGRLAALLVVHQRTPTAWTPDEIALIEETAERTWAASERARAETAARTQAARVAFLAETAASLLRGVDPEALLRDLAGPLAALVGMEAFTHYTADGDSLRLVTAEGFDPAAVAQNGHRAIGTGLSGRAAELRAPVVENDVQSSESPETAIARSLGLAAYGAFPLVAEGRLLGTVSLGTRGAARFDDGALDVVRAVCDYVAVAVAAAEAARHLAESETRYRMLFTSIDEGFALCEIVTDEAGVPVDYRFIEVNPAFFAMTGLPAGAAGQTARALIPDLEDHWIERYARAALGGETMRFVEGSAAMGRVFDVFAAPADTPGRFTAVFTDITARSMAEAALQSEARRAAYRVTLSDALRPLATPAAVHSTATRLLGEHLGASRVYSGAVSADGKDVTLGPDYHDGVPSAAGVHRLGAFGARLADGLREGRTMAASHVSADRSLSARELKTYAALGVEAYIGVPILRDGRLVGVLGTHHSTPRVWTPAEIALVEETAERTWNAAETARAEAAVRESEARARLALDIAAIGSWTWEPADDTMTPDARTGEICGIPSGRPLPVADVLARVHGDDRPRIAAALAAALDPDGDGLYAEDLRFVHADGSVRWTVARGQMRFDIATRAPASFAGTVLDVTDRETSAAAIRESDERLRLLVEGAQEYAFIGVDPDGRITTWSAGAERLFGLTEAEAVGEPIRIIYTPEDQAAGASEHEMAVARERGQALDERWHVRTSGSRFWGSGTMNALRDEDGRLRGYAKVLRDNTRRREDEQALIDSESRFRRAVEAAAVPVMLYTDDGEILAVSDAVVEITGYARDEIATVDAWLMRAYSAEAAATLAPRIAEHFADRRPIGPAEMEVRTATGEVRTWVFSAGEPETARDGRLFYACFASDVTERKRAEAALVALNETLDARVTERTQALAERTEQARALAGALTLAEQRERHRIAEVLHDHVQQLLYGVQIKLQLLPKAVPEKVPTVTGEISTLVSEALQAARSLTVELSPPVLQGEGLTAALRWLATQMEDTHGLRVAVSATGDGPPLSEERRVFVFQLVRELLFNVVKHAGVDEARVSVDEVPGRLTVRVEDDGVGFSRPADAVSADAFSDAGQPEAGQPEAGQADAPGSTGFGLVSLRQRLGPLGGRLTIVSSPGAGTRVEIELPL